MCVNDSVGVLSDPETFFQSTLYRWRPQAAKQVEGAHF